MLSVSCKRRRRGQSLVEYILLVALLSTLTTGFIRFLSNSVFRDGLQKLPDNANSLMSNGQ